MTTYIETERLIMREFTLDDAEAVYQFNSHEEVTLFTGDAGFVKSIDDAKSIINDIWLKEYQHYGYARWALVDKQSQQVIGFCGLKYEPELNAPDIGYRMLPEYWGKGLGMEASQAALEYGFKSLGLSYILGEVDIGNTASYKILHNLGFKQQKQYQKWGHDLIQLCIDVFPTLSDNQILLHQQTEQHTQDIINLYRHTEHNQQSDLFPLDTFFQAQKYIVKCEQNRRQGLGHQWLVSCVNQSSIIGSCGYLYNYSTRSATINMQFLSEYWQQEEALSAIFSAINMMCDWLFKQLHSLECIKADVLNDNQSFITLLEKCGFHINKPTSKDTLTKEKIEKTSIFYLYRSDILA